MTTTTVGIKFSRNSFDALVKWVERQDEWEQHLLKQEDTLRAFQQQLPAALTRFDELAQPTKTSTQETQNDYFTAQQMRQRLQAEPAEPLTLLERSYLPNAQALKEECKTMLVELQEKIEYRTRLLESWNRFVEEARYRFFLLQRFEDLTKLLKTRETEALLAAYNELELPMDAEPELPTQQTEPIMRAAEPNGSAIPQTPEVSYANEETQKALAQAQAQQEGSDARQYPRINLGTIAQLDLNSHGFYTGFTENISSGGVFIATYELTPQKGERFDLGFSLPNGYQVDVVAEVAWIREYTERSPEHSPGFGCKFISLSEADRVAIDEYIAKTDSIFMP